MVDAVREIGDRHVGETWLTRRRWSLYNNALLLAPTTISSYPASTVSNPASFPCLFLTLSIQPLTMPKKRCQFQMNTDARCTSSALRVAGDCPHCRAAFCSVASCLSVFPLSQLIHYVLLSIDFPNTTTALTWKTADNRHSNEIRAS